ncbi:MAG: hypothetical protein CMF72_05525 [Mameliella sp.]|nr:hypothetical protein [Mameliella sp.]|tara:strand:+ start:2090 stop:3004 length:915 start_codon:yes stop_codon:yes gene_type:complete
MQSVTNPTVVFIAGEGRSGSTVLDRCIGTAEGVASFNEMHEIVHQYRRNRKRCSCGDLPQDCAFWREVFADEELSANLSELESGFERYDGSRNAIRLLLGLYGPEDRRRLRRYGDLTAGLYRRIAEVAGVSVIIDSSKNPSRVLILKRYAGLGVWCLHLVRNPVAVAASWARAKSGMDDNLPTYERAATYTRWALKNLACEALRFAVPYKRIRFEAFTAAPRRGLSEIKAWVPALRGRGDGFESEQEVRFGPFHSLQGNPDRFESGLVEIRRSRSRPLADSGLSWFQRRMASRYGYDRSDDPSG